MHVVSQKNRVLTAVIALPVLVVAVALGGWPLWILLCLASVVGMEEFFGLVGRPPLAVRLLGAALGVLSILGTARYGFGCLAVAALAALWLEQFDFLRRFAFRGETELPRGAVVSAVLYVPSTLAVLGRLTPLETFFILAVVMAADTGAFYGGYTFGGPKVWPCVSPKKTVSGCVCGLVAGLVVGGVFGLFQARGVVPLALFGAVLAVVSQFGDFFESALKRAVGVKDSGRVLPGHGGVLDRIDGLLPAILVYAVCRMWWGLAG